MKFKFPILLFLSLLIPTAMFASCYTLEIRGAYYHPQSSQLRKKFSGGWLDYQVLASRWIDENVEVWGGVSWICKRKTFEKSSSYGTLSSPSYCTRSVKESCDSYYDYSDFSYDYYYSDCFSGYSLSDFSYSDFSDYSCYCYSSSHHKKPFQKLWLLPLSLGANYVFCLKNDFSFYVGAGAAYTFLNVQSHTEFLKRSSKHSGFGAILRSGLRYDSNDYMFLDFFVDYYWQRFKSSRLLREMDLGKGDIDLSGLKIGFGIGVYF